MKKMYEISSLQDIDSQRVVLLKQLRKQEKRVNQDFDRVRNSWNKWTNLGSIATNVATAFVPRINLFSASKKLFSQLFRKKK